MWDFMTEDNEILDPRLNFFFETNVDDEWVAFPQVPEANTPQSGGEPYSKDRRDAAYDNKGEGNIYSSVNFYLIRDELDVPEVLMTSAEVQFLRAEIFVRGIGVNPDASLASGAYVNGMLESMRFWQGIVEESEIWINKPALLDISGFFNVTQNPKYAIQFGESQEESLKKIYAQRWVDSFRQPWEAFSLLRRTNMLPRTKPDNDFHRFQYPPSESALNTENYNSQVTEMGGDETNIKVWWAK